MRRRKRNVSLPSALRLAQELGVMRKTILETNSKLTNETIIT